MVQTDARVFPELIGRVRPDAIYLPTIEQMVQGAADRCRLVSASRKSDDSVGPAALSAYIEDHGRKQRATNFSVFLCKK